MLAARSGCKTQEQRPHVLHPEFAFSYFNKFYHDEYRLSFQLENMLEASPRRKVQEQRPVPYVQGTSSLISITIIRQLRQGQSTNLYNCSSPHA